ncbi:unnamed protein product, partial [marine sediment metagenome]
MAKKKKSRSGTRSKRPKQVFDEPAQPTAADVLNILGPREKGARRLTKRQRKLILEVVRNPSGTNKEWGEAAGYAPSSAKQKAWDTLQKTNVREAVRELLNGNPATSLKGLTKTLAEGLQAKETKFFQEKGRVTDEREVIDHGTRHRYMDSGLKLHGALGHDANPDAPAGGMSFSIMLGKMGTDDDREDMVDALIAVRVTRGMHPT